MHNVCMCLRVPTFFTKIESLVAREGMRVHCQICVRTCTDTDGSTTNTTCVDALFSHRSGPVCVIAIGCSSVAPGHMVYSRCPRDSSRRGSARLGEEK